MTSSARSALRELVGDSLGRGYYAKSTAQPGSTASRIVDTKRVEFEASWEGAALLISGEEAVVTSNDPDGSLYLAAALAGGAPANGTSYELLRGWTFKDLNRALGEALARCYPWLYEPLNDRTTVTEAADTYLYTLNVAWKKVTQIRRKVPNSSPEQWQDWLEGREYVLRRAASGALELELRVTPIAGNPLWVIGEKAITLASGDSATCPADDQVIVDGALWWLFDKGPDPAEAQQSRWTPKAERQWQMFQQSRITFAMERPPDRVKVPRLAVTNDGSSVTEG